MKKNIRMALVLAGLLTVVSAVAAIKTKEQKSRVQKQQDAGSKGVTTFALFRLVLWQ